MGWVWVIPCGSACHRFTQQGGKHPIFLLNPTHNPQAALVAAYGRRLQRLAALLHQYDAQLHRALAALGVTQQQRGQQPREQQQQQDAQPSTDALAALAAGLQQLEQQIVTAVEGSTAEPLSQEALLGLASGTDLAAAAAAAGPTAILQALQGVAMALSLGWQ